MGQAQLAALPGGKIRLGKGPVHGAHTALGPHSLRRFVQVLLEHHLHQSMQVEQSGLRVALDQRVATQELDGCVEEQGIRRHRREQRPQLGRSFGHNGFGNGIRVEEGAQAQKVRSGSVSLLEPAEKEIDQVLATV